MQLLTWGRLSAGSPQVVLLGLPAQAILQSHTLRPWDILFTKNGIVSGYKLNAFLEIWQ